MLSRWENLPDEMKTEDVQYYYDILSSKRIQLFFKRTFDIIVSFTLLLILFPLIILISVLIKIDSKGRIIYKQDRVTKNMKVFKVWKFRTMVENADKIGSHITSDNDARVTKIGNKIRKYRIDEIPQLVNVLCGTMSLVGTRPEAIKYVEAYDDKMKATLLLPAGITSKTSVYFKDEAQMLKDSENIDLTYIDEVLPLKMKMNLKSLEEFSFIDDIKTMFLTLIKVLK